MEKKGQVSIEFIIVIVLLLALFLFSLTIFSERNSGYIYSKESYEARLIADKLAAAVNTVHLAGPGTEANVLLEERGIDFNVSVTGNAVVVEWRDSHIDSGLLTDNVTTGAISTGNLVNVKNVNGGIEVENA